MYVLRLIQQVKDVIPSGQGVEVDSVRIEVLWGRHEGPEGAQGWTVDPEGPGEGAHNRRKKWQEPARS